MNATMSLNPKVSAPVAGANGGQVPAPLSRLILLQRTVSQPVFAAFLAGGVAGAVSRTVVSPLERLKILFQIQSVGREEYKLSVGQGLKKMWKDEGWRGYMRGNGTNCIRIVPYSAVQFGSYNFYKRVCSHLILPTSDATPVDIITDVSRLVVCRVYAWRRSDTSETTCLRRRSWHNLRYLYISS